LFSSNSSGSRVYYAAIAEQRDIQYSGRGQQKPLEPGLRYQIFLKFKSFELVQELEVWYKKPPVKQMSSSTSTISAVAVFSAWSLSSSVIKRGSFGITEGAHFAESTRT
jgi:hypothetical protein